MDMLPSLEVTQQPPERTSMSTSLLYHAFGLRGYRHLSSSFEGGRVTFSISQPRDQLRCPDCSSDNVWAQGSVTRTFRTVPIGAKPVQI